MGQSTDAHVAFGVDLGEELPEFLEDFEDGWEDFLASISGLPQYGEKGHSFKDQEAFVKAFPVTLLFHCSYEYPMYILAVNGTDQRASRGYPHDLTPLIVTPEQVDALKAFMAEHGIDGEPKWLLFSMMG
jgi:hypothetical protein